MAPIIELKNVSKVYSLGEVRVHALKEVSLQVKKGEFAAIVGSSGSGKSTLMHIIGLLDKPSSGEVFLNGKKAGSLSDDERSQLRNKNIGFVFQAFNLLPRTSALDNVALPLIYAGISKEEREKKAAKMLKLVGLGERLDHTSTQLSGGQQQRVAIARALINNPEMILADEPTGNLDTASGKEIMNLFTDLNKKGNTIVLVTHELDIAKGTKRIIEVKDGALVGDYRN